MEKSTHKAEVVPIELLPHENADALSIVKVWGYTVVVRTEDWKNRDRGVYLVPDTLVPNHPSTEFLFDGKRSLYNVTSDGYAEKSKSGEYARITAIRLRGTPSQGLLIPAPEGAEIGDDVAEQLGVCRYEPVPSCSTAGEDAPAPSGYIPSYDVDSLNRYFHVFEEGENVCVTEKVHGANGRWCFRDGEMHCGSRTRWKEESEKSIWWQALSFHPEVREFCEKNQNCVVYGEVYGQVQKGFDYGVPKGSVRIAVFDILRNGEWVNASDLRTLGPDLPWVPSVAGAQFDMDQLRALADGPSLIPGAENIREGIVVKPWEERNHPEVGRVNLKLISFDYLEGKRKK